MLYSLKAVPPLRMQKHAPRNFAATQSCAQGIALITGAGANFCLVEVAAAFIKISKRKSWPARWKRQSCVTSSRKWHLPPLLYLLVRSKSRPCPSSTGYETQEAGILVVQSLSHVWLFATPWTAAPQASLSLSISRSLFIESRMPPNHLILCHPLLLLPSIFPSIRVFPNELALCVWWPKYCSFGISPSSEYSGLISFRIDWFDLLAVQGTLKSVLQNHNLITWIIALCNSMKLWGMQSKATQDGWVMLESSDKTWSTGEGNGKPFLYSCLENSMV